MNRTERKAWVVGELRSMTNAEDRSEGLYRRKRALIRELHTLWPSPFGVNELLLRRIVEAVKASRRRGMTGDEMERSLRVLHQSLGRPLLIARARGLIQNSGKTRKTRNKVDAIVWIAGGGA